MGSSLSKAGFVVMVSFLIRFVDLVLALVVIICTAPLMLAIFCLMLTVTPDPIFRQTRVGLDRSEFIMFKFRTMKTGTSDKPTHMTSPSDHVRFGGGLRASKLDELPQAFNVLRGDMSWVGPRPCLPSQVRLIEERSARGVYRARPGVTGLAQIIGIDMRSPRLLARIDAVMVRRMTFRLYAGILFMTLRRVLTMHS